MISFGDSFFELYFCHIEEEEKEKEKEKEEIR